MKELVKELTNILDGSKKSKTGPYDVEGKVKRLDGDIAWVKLNGGIDETPVKKTIACQPGDTVQVRVGGGSAYIAGNTTAPPTDDKVAKEAAATAMTASKAATEVQESIEETNETVSGMEQVLEEVQAAQESTNNHFWFDNTGAYVTEEDGTYTSGYATRVTNQGILQTYNGNVMTAWTNSGITFDDSIPFAIGNSSSYIKWVLENGTWKIKIAADEIQMGSSDVLARDDVSLTRLSYGVQINMGDDSETVYDGTDGTDVTSQYVTRISNYTGISVHEANDLQNFALFNSNGMQVYKNISNSATQVASFGSTVSIGSGNEIYISSGGVRVGGADGIYIGINEDDFAYIGSTGIIQITEEDGYGSRGIECGKIFASGTIEATGRIYGDERFNSLYTYSNRGSETSSNLYVGPKGNFMRIGSSSRRYKEDIDCVIDEKFDPHRLYNLPVRQFRYKYGYIVNEDGDPVDNKLQVGFIAEEVNEYYPDATVFAEDQIESWSERKILPPMLALIQEHKAKLDELEAEINALKGAR